MVPDFFASEYFVPETDNWHLKPGAPKEIVDEFNEYMRLHPPEPENGIITD